MRGEQGGTIYGYRDKILVTISVPSTTEGIRVYGGCPFVLHITDGAARIGGAVLAALAASDGPPQEPPKLSAYKTLWKPLLEGAGVRSYPALAKEASNVMMRRLVNQPIEFIPSRNAMKTEKMFYALFHRAVYCDSLDEETVGVSLVKALNLCE